MEWREPSIWKYVSGVLNFVEYFHTLFCGLNRHLISSLENAPLITSFSTSVVKYTGLALLGSSFVAMEVTEKLGVEYLEFFFTPSCRNWKTYKTWIVWQFLGDTLQNAIYIFCTYQVSIWIQSVYFVIIHVPL